MPETIISSKTKTVIISPERQFTVIGERINPTGRKLLAREMAAGNYDRVVKDALAQVAAGAHMLDVNAGIPLADEPAILAKSIQLVQSVTDVPISIDSSIVEALERGLEVYEGKALLNSVTGEEERLEVILPMVKKYGCAVIGISNDETGISEDPDVRFAVAKKIVERAMDHGIPREDVVIDPLVMPIGAMRYAGRQAFRIIQRCNEELGVNTCCGASNISFGLPYRGPLNGTFLSMAMAAGMASAITNPIEQHIKESIMAADVMMGNDENCLAWIKEHRDKVKPKKKKPAADGTAAPAPEGRQRRERRRRRSS
ncbi:MAG: dihydropteroate synthase [Chloroflexota bacterium]